MENINSEGLNNLISLYQVVGIFVIIICCLIICWLLIKLLQWSYTGINDYCEKSDKELIKETIEEYKKGH